MAFNRQLVLYTHYDNRTYYKEDTCMSFSISSYVYYVFLQEGYSQELVDFWIDSINKEICDNTSISELKFYKEKVINHLDGSSLSFTVKNCIEVVSKLKHKINRYRLFINQILRYLLEPHLFPIVKTTYDLKLKYPELEFFQLFHLAHIINNNLPYDKYYQPFYDIYCKVSSLEAIKKPLHTENSITSINSAVNTNFNNVISKELINNIKKYYGTKDDVEFLNTFNFIYNYRDIKIVCIDSNGTTNLTVGKEYKVIEEFPNLYLIINDDFKKVNFMKSRFKIV